jgi:hypothetical protein
LFTSGITNLSLCEYCAIFNAHSLCVFYNLCGGCKKKSLEIAATTEEIRLKEKKIQD